MRLASVRTTIDIPRDLYDRLKLEVGRSRRSMRALILDHVPKGLGPQEPNRRVRFPLIRGVGQTIDLTNEQISEIIDAPERAPAACT